jgi:hypothetical protein
MKKQLTHHEEFEILKIVIDKILLVGILILGVGFYKMTTDPFQIMWQGVAFLIAGFIILALLMFLLVKEYEIIR